MRPLLVVGSINVDISVRVPRLPAAGETLMGRGALLGPGGKGANQAHAARRDGAEVCLVGAVGDDGFAALALRELQHAGVDLTALNTVFDAATGVAAIQVTDEGENAIALAPGANARLRPGHVDAAVDAATWARHDLLLQWELPPDTTMHAAARARAAGSRVMLNLAPARDLDGLDLGRVDWCLLNASELEALASHLSLSESGARAARELARRVGHGVVLTLGADGMMAFARPDGPAGQAAGLEGIAAPGLGMRAHDVEVVDSTGAGDTFCGVFAAALAAGLAPVPALRRAHAAAALCCTGHGAQGSQPWRRRIDALLATSNATSFVPAGAALPEPKAASA